MIGAFSWQTATAFARLSQPFAMASAGLCWNARQKLTSGFLAHRQPADLDRRFHDRRAAAAKQFGFTLWPLHFHYAEAEIRVIMVDD